VPFSISQPIGQLELPPWRERGDSWNMPCVGFLDRLDDCVVGPKGQPPDPRRMRAGHWLGIAVVLAVVVAGFLSSGSNNPVVWPLAGMALGSLIFGRRSAVSQRPPTAPGPVGNDDEGNQAIGGDTESHSLASRIADAEQHHD
jgi:hypothetical protein